jgi:recombinational DNA repair ATPase RecF
MTILAGKNESGKTSMLEALEDCHEDNTIRETAKPIEGDAAPSIDLFFELSKNEVNDILKEAGIKKSVSNNTTIGIRKQLGER